MSLPDLNWIYGEDHKEILHKACCHFLNCCDGVECADLRFKVKEDKPYEGLHTEVVHRFKCDPMHKHIAAAVNKYSCIPEEDWSKLGIGYVTEGIVEAKGVLINIKCKSLPENYYAVEVKLTGNSHNSSLTNNVEYCKSYGKFIDKIKEIKANNCGQEKELSTEDIKKNTKIVKSSKNINLDLAAMTWVFCGNGGSLIYIPLREHKKFHKDIEMHGGLYLYNPSGKQISIKVSQLEYCRAMLHLIGNLDKIVLFTDAQHKETVLENFWTKWREELKNIFAQWNSNLSEHIKNYHDYMTENEKAEWGKTANNLWLYDELTGQNYFTKVSNKITYERMKFIKQKQGSIVGFISGLYERFKCADVKLKLKYDNNNYMEQKNIFEAMVGKYSDDSFCKIGLDGLSLDEEINLIDFIFILSNCGAEDIETLQKRTVILELSDLIGMNHSFYIKICGKNITTDKAYPYVIQRDIRNWNHKGGSSEILIVANKLKMYNLYANRFPLPMASDKIDSNHPSIKLSYEPDVVNNYYDWDNGKASFCITLKCSER